MKWYGIVAVILLTGFLGCKEGDGTEAKGNDEGTENTEAVSSPTAQDDHGHSHADGGPVLEGHLVDLSSESGETLHAEWNHDDDEETVSVVLLDASEENAISMPGAQVIIRTKVEEEEAEVHSLPALPAGEGILTDSQFEVVDKNLVTLVEFEEVVCTLQITVGDVVYTADLGDDHDHSGHDH